MKPLGMDPLFRVMMPSRTEDAIWNAVEEAILAGWTAAQFKREVAAAWEESLKRNANEAVKELMK